MGDRQDDTVRVEFDRKIKLGFHGSTVTSDAGLRAYRELDDALGLASTAASRLHDTRTGQNTQHGLLALLRQSICSRLAGYEGVNGAETTSGEYRTNGVGGRVPARKTTNETAALVLSPSWPACFAPPLLHSSPRTPSPSAGQ